ncbi:MAG: ATP-binding cassette domain-containing protein [Bryobacteraceae bacterium]
MGLPELTRAPAGSGPCCAIRAYGLGKKFRRATALEPLDLEVPAGAIYGLVGPRAAGKTTCIKVLLNILPPSAGRAEVLGADSRRLAPRDFAQIGYLAETPEMPARMTVGYYLRFLSGFYPTWDAGIESALIRQFQLRLDRKLADLSRAARMKTALVSSLAYRPKLLVLDEPFRGLDPLSRGELLHALLGRDPGHPPAGATIFLSAEDVAEVEAFASHIGYLEGSRLRFSEELDALRARFREIVLTFTQAPLLPGDWPAAWIAPERGPSTLRFIETRFDAERTPAEARRRLPGFHGFAANPMPLSGILAALVRTWRPGP